MFIPDPVRWMNRTSYRASMQLSFLICKIGTVVSETKGDSFKASRFIWEKAMVPHSGILAWKIPRMESLQSMGSLSRTQLSDFTFTPCQKEMATHFSVLAWRIPGTGVPGGLQGYPSMGSHRSDMTEAT